MDQSSLEKMVKSLSLVSDRIRDKMAVRLGIPGCMAECVVIIGVTQLVICFGSVHILF